MAMTVVNNPSANMTLGELNKNVSKLGKQLSKVASGLKIVSAGDGTADYSISERMQAQIRSLRQDIDNTRTGRSMLKVAEGGIQGIVDELREMKQLAINAANDSNTDADRATIQKEFDEKLKQIDDIVATTHYNGKLLLNGEYGRGWSYTAIDNAVIDGGVSTGVIEPSGTPVTLTSGNHTITASGVYELAEGFTGDITIADGLAGVKITQATSEKLKNVYINGPASGKANLWLEDLNIEYDSKSPMDSSFLKFFGSDNVLSIKGKNIVGLSQPQAAASAMIHIGNGLTIEGTGSLDMCCNNFLAAMIGTNQTENSNANLTINSGNYTLTAIEKMANFGAAIGSGISGGIGDITINGGNFDISCSGDGTNIGSGRRGSAGNITIKNASIKGLASGGACIGSGGGAGKSSVGNITIEESLININTIDIGDRNNPSLYGGAGIGSGRRRSDAGNITIRDSIVNISAELGAGIGSGYDSHAGVITIENMTGNVTSNQGEAIGRGVLGSVDGVNVRTKYKPLIVHTGTKANQRINCYIENLDTKALFKVKTDEALEKVASVRTRASAQRLLGSLTDPSVDGPLDKAINYALNEMTQVGSYINRLEQTEDTLTISHENTTSSESTIRDADMAKEMMEYTKSNVLTQAAQSMLAQANQNSSSVLSLLQ
ncbi:flagellin [Selenomonas sp. KH1T6]|uniref:flagellin N-terminal helical domain-containing protein n=1 Tax=Selenomonas sp. KH1T6 TaxID=3158784 RepID=UPI0008A7D720|nr:flagellin [Selenomonas ruminantium]